MLRVASLSRCSAAYSVVVLPLPVGPVTSRMPCGRWINWSTRSSVVSSMPSSDRSSRPACLSSRRSTTRSPWPAGIVDTRTSTGRPAIRRPIRPSCGSRRSAMSSLAMTLIRDTTGCATAFCGASTSRSTPSTRKRTTSRDSNGSMWMSEAFSLTASVSSALISRMIGASSSDSSRSVGSGSASASEARSACSSKSAAIARASSAPPSYSSRSRRS